MIFNIDNLSDINGLSYDGLVTEFVMHPRAFEHFEIFFNLLDEPDRVRMDWAYNTDLFDRVTIERHLARFVRLLEGLAAAPDTPLGETGRFLAAAAPAGAPAGTPAPPARRPSSRSSPASPAPTPTAPRCASATPRSTTPPSTRAPTRWRRICGRAASAPAGSSASPRAAAWSSRSR